MEATVFQALSVTFVAWLVFGDQAHLELVSGGWIYVAIAVVFAWLQWRRRREQKRRRALERKE